MVRSTGAPLDPTIDHGALVAAKHGLVRSDKWPEVEHTFKAANPTCAACSSRSIQVHHVMPFHFCILLGRPDLELDPRNLISLCETQQGMASLNHHILLGHLDSFQSYNPNVRADVVTYKDAIPFLIRAAKLWKAAVIGRPPTWAIMTDDEKAAFRTRMDNLYPIDGSLVGA